MVDVDHFTDMGQFVVEGVCLYPGFSVFMEVSTTFSSLSALARNRFYLLILASYS